MNFDEMILEAAKAIMAASSTLVRAANAAQRELIDQGKVSKRPLTSSDDGQWSEGLISAARFVAAATHSLVEAAQNLVQGVGTEEMLISSAKQVASSTAQLLIACKVKSDANSESGRRLQQAGNAVIKSTENLVRAAQQAIESEEEHTLRLNSNMVNGMTQEINARSEVLKRERELEEARNKLAAIRQAKYRQKLAQGFTTDDSDNEGGGPNSTGGSKGGYGFQSPSPNHFNNRSAFNGSPSSPSFLNTTSSTAYHQHPSSNNSTPQHTQIAQQQTQQQHHQQQQQQRTMFTANATPKPYNSSEIHLQSPHLLQSTYDTTIVQNANLQTNNNNNVSTLTATTSPFRQNLEGFVQDLHQKTIGSGTYKTQSPIPTNLSTFKSSTGTGPDGNNYSSR